ncbi:HPr family phosphocarrier protein, partial [Xanthomonas translucens pv. translucens]
MLVASELVRVNVQVRDKADAIAQAAQLLVAAGCVPPAYAASMLRREALANTFLGHGVAIPHCTGDDRHLVQRDGIAVLQIRDGVEWNPGQTTHLVVAIAAQSDTHITLLRRLTRLIQDQPRLGALFASDDPQAIVDALSQDAVAAASGKPVADFGERFEWTVAYPTGLHARPATRWVETARGFAARIQVRAGEHIGDAKNLVSLLQLGLHAGDTVTISAEGQDAAAALARLRSVIDGLTAQEKADAQAAAQRRAAPVTGWTPPQAQPAIVGIGASPGLAIGVVHKLAGNDGPVPDAPVPLSDGGALLHDALLRTRQQLQAI